MAAHPFPILSLKSLQNSMAVADPELCSHGRRVGLLAQQLAECMGLAAGLVTQVAWAAQFHDIGKLFLPSFLVHKQDPLGSLEYRILQRHASLGAGLLGRCAETEALAEVARHHHERWDGTGYPSRLKRLEIPLVTRIVSVADVYDAVTSDRPGGNRSHDAAMGEILGCRGRQLSPEVVDAFLQIETRLTRDRILHGIRRCPVVE